MLFIRNYLTKDLVEELDLFLYELQGDQWVIVEKNWEKIRDNLVSSMTNFGSPVIMVEDGDYRRNSELYLKHYFEGQETRSAICRTHSAPHLQPLGPSSASGNHL